MDPAAAPQGGSSNVAPPMPSPPEAPVTPFGPDSGAPIEPGMGMPGGSPEASPEQKQQLMDLISQIRAKLAETNANMFAGTNKSEQTRIDALKQLFEMMQSAGVNLQDPVAVQAFIDKMREMNPDVAQMFEDALQGLLNEGGSEAPAEEMPESPEMSDVTGNVEALPEDIRGRGEI